MLLLSGVVFGQPQITKPFNGGTGVSQANTKTITLGGPLTTTGTINVTTQSGTGTLVSGTAPTISNPIITNIAPAANFTITQNSVVPFTSVNTGAIVNTLYLDAGNIGVGAAASGLHKVLLGGTITSAGNANGVTQTTTITPAVNGNAVGVNLAPTLVMAGSGTHAVFATTFLQPPTVTAGAATLTEAATLYISGTPSAGTNNYAVHVVAGNTKLAGTLTVDTAAGLILLTSSSPASGAACTAGAMTWDASYIYVCTATGVWKRAALTGGY